MVTMSTSLTKQKAVARLAENALLQTPLLAQLPAHAQDLSPDQPTTAPLAAVLENSQAALEQGETHYVDVPGIAPLRTALADYLNNLGLTGYAEANVLVTAGVQESRFLTIQKIGEKFGRIGIPAVIHPGARKAAGVRAIEINEIAVDVTSSALPTPEAIRSVLADGCRLLYLESPSRLTGEAYSADNVAAIAALLMEFDAAAIWDQGQAPWVQNYVSLGSQPGMADRVAVIGESWPGIGLESWAIGYIAAKADWWEPMRSQKQIMAICTNTASQYAALKGAEIYGEVHADQVASLSEQQAAAKDAARAGGFIILNGDAVNLLAVSGVDTAALDAAGVTYADGAIFGAPGIVRLLVSGDGATAQAIGG
ncbi:aminotransferase class I/II-fold pyridoxal phosphate-dependent enzyme [bacterium]|nr:aminotransferase class I/II-fold pyridoxal phosphate-dependent enzyme [bacterium]